MENNKVDYSEKFELSNRVRRQIYELQTGVEYFDPPVTKIDGIDRIINKLNRISRFIIKNSDGCNTCIMQVNLKNIEDIKKKLKRLKASPKHRVTQVNEAIKVCGGRYEGLDWPEVSYSDFE